MRENDTSAVKNVQTKTKNGRYYSMLKYLVDANSHKSTCMNWGRLLANQHGPRA